MSGLFACKSVEALTAEAEAPGSKTTLPRTLGLFSLTCFGVGSTIGAGIFVLTGTVAAVHAGPAVVLAFVLAGAACALAGLCCRWLGVRTRMRMRRSANWWPGPLVGA